MGAALAVAAALAGCLGDIADRDEGTPEPGTPGASGAPSGGNGDPGPGPGGPDPGTVGSGAPVDPGDPGRVSLRRLNRAEYNNTVRDLLGTALAPADAFDADLAGFGYDNNGDVQLLTTLQVEQYGSAAEALATEATAGGAGKIAIAARVAACDPAAAGCVRQLVSGLARRAFRRPVADDEVDRLMRLAERAKARGEDALAQLRDTVVGVLTSPHFLFRVELDAGATTRALDGHELAARLSYLFYRSMPDDALAAAAAGGRLRTADDVAREAGRMLADPRGAELVNGFVAQWLDINSLTQHAIDAEKLGATFDRELALSMQAETKGVFAAMLADNLPVTELLTAPWSMLDARLAQHYGLPRPAGPGPVRVELTNPRRRGLLTHASILTATSNPDRTSPVARGAWVMTHLLCAPPPPPPPDVPSLPEGGDAPMSARAQLEAHRADPGCAACHKLMDPIGLGLENYDAIGRWREMEFGQPIDASGELLDGSGFSGAAELAALLIKDPGVPDCIARNLYTYALGRHPADGSVDAKHVARIVAGASSGGRLRLRDLVLGIVTSEPFRMRRGEAPSVGGRP